MKLSAIADDLFAAQRFRGYRLSVHPHPVYEMLKCYERKFPQANVIRLFGHSHISMTSISMTSISD